MQQASPKNQAWYDKRLSALGLAVVLALAAFGLASRAIYTGSLQQYGLAILSLVLFFRELAVAVWPGKQKTQSRKGTV